MIDIQRTCFELQVEASATYGSKHCLRHAVVTEPIDQSHDFSFIHKFYYENYYNETRAFMGMMGRGSKRGPWT